MDDHEGVEESAASAPFPWLSEEFRIRFPDPQDMVDGAISKDDEGSYTGFIGIGANLSPGVLISAYEQGVFPWFSPGEPICWWSPLVRTVIYPDRLHISKSMRRFLRHTRLFATYDTAFPEVIRSCRVIPRKKIDGAAGEYEQQSWITDEMEEAYIRLHRSGYAHSIEIRDPERGDALCGGLYGVSVGKVFCGESMFSLLPQTSKMALITLIQENPVNPDGLKAVDCKFMTPHLRSLGAESVARKEYLDLLPEHQRSC